MAVSGGLILALMYQVEIHEKHSVDTKLLREQDATGRK